MLASLVQLLAAQPGLKVIGHTGAAEAAHRLIASWMPPAPVLEGTQVMGLRSAPLPT